MPGDGRHKGFACSVLRSEQCSVTIIPALEDNYMYLITDLSTKEAAVIDPVSPSDAINAAAAAGSTITSVLTTHSHWDHAGGNNAIKSILGDQLKHVYGGMGDNAEGVTKEVTEGDSVFIGNLEVKVMSTPCHTKGHVSYVVLLQDAPQLVFTGDTLFVGGCGNFNKGTPSQMAENFRALGSLKGDTLVYCGHEYTASNLAYAAFVEPNNSSILDKLKWATSAKCTVPSTILDEHLTNPFMRAVFGNESLIKHTKTDDPVAAILYVRKEKSRGDWKKKTG